MPSPCSLHLITRPKPFTAMGLTSSGYLRGNQLLTHVLYTHTSGCMSRPSQEGETVHICQLPRPGKPVNRNVERGCHFSGHAQDVSGALSAGCGPVQLYQPTRLQVETIGRPATPLFQTCGEFWLLLSRISRRTGSGFHEYSLVHLPPYVCLQVIIICELIIWLS